MLGIVNQLAAMLLEIRHGFRDQRKILIFADAERTMDMKIPALAEDGNDRRLGVEEFANIAIVLHRILRETCRPERSQLRVMQPQALRLSEELAVTRVGARPPAFNVINTQLIQFPRNEDFVIHGKRDSFALRAVTKSGIER